MYQSTRCHNKEDHNTYLHAVGTIFSFFVLILLPLLLLPYLTLFISTVHLIVLSKDSKQFVLTRLLRPLSNSLYSTAADWTQFAANCCTSYSCFH